jgi:hypothetical protein
MGMKMERVKERKPKGDFAKGANSWPTEVSDLERYFGYNCSRNDGESPFDIPTAGLVCIVANVTPENREVLRQKTRLDCRIGDWLISCAGRETPITHGPFKTADQVFGFARAKLNAVRFIKQSDPVVRPAM